MPDSRRVGRHGIVRIPWALVIALVASGLAAAPVTAHEPEPPGIDAFMKALGLVESNGDYEARNRTSGAYGKYQIMPSNWPAWAERYLGNASAPQSPRNQELVARRKIAALYRWLGSWPVVAHWWLTGDKSRQPAAWSSSSKKYVAKVMTLVGKVGAAPAAAAPPRSPITLQETHEKLRFRGGWSRASHGRYMGGDVRYSNTAGARLTFRFTGTAFQWIGPRGPTRGEARVYVNRELAGTVDLYASRFKARNVVFQRTYARAITREVVIVVVGTRRHPTVAVDAIVIRR